MHIGILRMHIPEDHLTKEVYEGDLPLPYEVYGKSMWYIKKWCREELKHIPEDHTTLDYSDNHLIQLKRLDRKERYLEVKPISAKGKRVPIRGTATPQMASRFGWYLKTEFKEDENVHYWNDWQCVLKWRQHHERGYINVVRSRITEILDTTGGNLWRHCQTGDNTADLPTKGSTVDQLKTATTWWNGPHGLSDEEAIEKLSTPEVCPKPDNKLVDSTTLLVYVDNFESLILGEEDVKPVWPENPKSMCNRAINEKHALKLDISKPWIVMIDQVVDQTKTSMEWKQLFGRQKGTGT
jgi:hypothetical protein